MYKLVGELGGGGWFKWHLQGAVDAGDGDDQLSDGVVGSGWRF